MSPSKAILTDRRPLQGNQRERHADKQIRHKNILNQTKRHLFEHRQSHKI